MKPSGRSIHTNNIFWIITFVFFVFHWNLNLKYQRKKCLFVVSRYVFRFLQEQVMGNDVFDFQALTMKLKMYCL